mmetsp:Transcript_16161/g.32712  ORF Transcript_16161/g.32712 Transcript_16161/m.32712 type:complete len:131 (-) Transcript_16161:1900-2292(-)
MDASIASMSSIADAYVPETGSSPSESEFSLKRLSVLGCATSRPVARGTRLIEDPANIVHRYFFNTSLPGRLRRFPLLSQCVESFLNGTRYQKPVHKRWSALTKPVDASDGLRFKSGVQDGLHQDDVRCFG